MGAPVSTLRSWTSLILGPLWRWKWLFLLCVVITGGYAIFSGVALRYPFGGNGFPRGLLMQKANYGHGWPFIFAQRFVMPTDTLGAWKIWSDVHTFALASLLWNLAIAIAVSLTATCLVAWRFSGLRRWQFRLGELLVATFLIAGLFGVARRLESDFQQDERYLTSQTISYWAAIRFGPPTWYVRPFCDLHLVSAEAVDGRALYDFGAPDDFNQRIIQAVERGEKIRGRVSLLQITSNSLDDAGVAAIAAWAPRCEELELVGDNRFTDKAIVQIAQQLPKLRRLTLGSPNLTLESLPSLSRMPRLQFLTIHACSDAVSPAALNAIDGVTPLTRLEIPAHLYDQTGRKLITNTSGKSIYITPTLESLFGKQPSP